MNKNAILGIGTSGMVGSRIKELLSDTYHWYDVNRSNGYDICQKEKIEKVIGETDASIVLHLAAKADVDGCEKDKEERENGTAWKMNVEGTRNVVDACKKNNKKLIYISTDFVFNGDDTPVNGYTEESLPCPINWYGQTKYEGEKIVMESTIPWVIMRIAYPYRAISSKKDFAQIFQTFLQEQKQLRLVEDHIMCPTFIDDIAVAMVQLLQEDQTGVFHVCGNSAISPYQAGMIIANIFHLNPSLIHKTTRELFFQGRAKRPYNLTLKNDKIHKLDVPMRSFEEGLLEIKKQL